MHLLWDFIILIHEMSFPVSQIILHCVGINTFCYEFTFYVSYHLHSGYEM
jgi:hypothetical protein